MRAFLPMSSRIGSYDQKVDGNRGEISRQFTVFLLGRSWLCVERQL